MKPKTAERKKMVAKRSRRSSADKTLSKPSGTRGSRPRNATRGKKARAVVRAEAEQRATAFHEAGHAIASILLPFAPSLRKVTIVPSGDSLGHVMLRRSSRTRLLLRPKIHHCASVLDAVTVLVSGEMAERLAASGANTGAVEREFQKDFWEVSAPGLGGDLEPAMCMAVRASYDTRDAVAFIDWARARALSLLLANWCSVELLAHELLQVGTLSGAEVRRIILLGPPTDAFSRAVASSPAGVVQPLTSRWRSLMARVLASRHSEVIPVPA